MDNTSGGGHAATVPAEIDRWNWGAFLLNWIWGIGNNTWIALLTLLPFANFVMPFVLGAKGSAWAWRNKRWESIEHFRRVQRLWAIWGAVVWLLLIAAFVAIFFAVSSMLKSSDVYRLSVAKLHANAEAMAILGPPIETGLVSGSFRSSGPSGETQISFAVEGRKAKGTVYVLATKHMGQWTIDQAVLEIDGRPERIDLNRGT